MLNIAGLKIPMIGDHLVTGNVYFLDSGATGASDSNDGLRPDRGHALATLDGANDKCTASNGDFIVVMPGHAETTTAIALDTAGVTIIGVGHGADIPTLTATAAASDLVDVSAASVWIENIKFVGAASAVTALLDCAAAADNITIKSCEFANAAAPVDTITIAPTCNTGTIIDCLFRPTAANIANCILFEQNAAGVSQVNANWTIKNCVFNMTDSAGCDDGCIVVSTSSGGVTGILVQDCTFLGLADGEAAIESQGVSSGRATGLAINLISLCADATDSFVASDLLGWVECHSLIAGDHATASMVQASRMPLTSPDL